MPAETPIAELMRKARAVIAAAGGTKTDNRAVKEMASSYMQLLTELHEDKVETALERARSSGKLVPVMENWARELASNNLTAFEAWEACAIPAITLGGSGLAGRKPPPRRYASSENSERRAVCAQLGISPGEEE